MIEMVSDSDLDRDLAPALPNSPDPFLGALWRRRWILTSVLLGCLGLGAVVHVLLPPVYESRAEVLLIKQMADPDDSFAAGEVNIEDDLNTQMTIFRSVRVVTNAIATYKLDQLSSIQDLDPETPIVTHIIDHLGAVRGGSREFPDPNVMHVTYEGSDAEQCEIILSAVIDSYQEFLGATYQSFGKQALVQISQAKNVLDTKLNLRKDEYREFRKNAPVMLRAANGEEMTVHQVRLADFESRRADVLHRLSEVEAGLREVETASTQGVSSNAVALMVNRYQPQPSAATATANLRAQLESQLIETMVEEQRLWEFGSEHPEVLALRQHIDLLQDRIEQMPAEEAPESSDEKIAVYIDALQHELGMLRTQRDDLDRRFAREESKLRAIRQYLERDEDYSNDLENFQELFDVVLGQLEKMSLVKDYAGISAQVISDPEEGDQIAPTIAMTGLISFAIGTLLGLTVVWVLESCDQRFISPQELRGHLGLPVLGHIPLLSKESRQYARLAQQKLPQRVDESLCTFYQPGAPISEAYRSLRTILHFDAKNHDNRVIQITSAMPGDGKTTIAANVAITLAQSGKRVMLLDADLRKPRLGNVFGIESELGTGEILQGHGKLNDAVVQTAVKNLWLLPCGAPPSNPSELLMSARFKQLLEELRRSCDIVIVDSPPLLPITDSTLIAPLVDSVLLAVKLSNQARDMSRKAVESLREINATVLGVVVNGVDARGSTYRQRSRYDYEYRYPSRYQANGTPRTNGHKVTATR